MAQHTIVTAANLDAVREDCRAVDQRREMVAGCETWNTDNGGCMTVWPSEDRGAIAWSGCDSVWGEWDADKRTLTLDDGGAVNATGAFVAAAA